MTKSGIPLGEYSGSDATDRLHATIAADSRWIKVGTLAAGAAALLSAATFLVEVL
jgi:hypothetical protein